MQYKLVHMYIFTGSNILVVAVLSTICILSYSICSISLTKKFSEVNFIFRGLFSEIHTYKVFLY